MEKEWTQMKGSTVHDGGGCCHWGFEEKELEKNGYEEGPQMKVNSSQMQCGLSVHSD